MNDRTDAAKDLAQLSDGYHTFAELYEHRHALFIALCRRLDLCAWRSRQHADGTSFPGWFIMGLYRAPGEQITYHLPERLWDRTHFVETLDHAPEWDGHTSAEVVRRLWDLSA